MEEPVNTIVEGSAKYVCYYEGERVFKCIPNYLKTENCVLKLVMTWEALLRRFSQIMLSGPYQTQLSVLMTSLSPQTLSHTHILSLSPGLLMARNAVAANHKKLSSHMTLPEMLREAHICKHCPYLPQCCLAHK